MLHVRRSWRGPRPRVTGRSPLQAAATALAAALALPFLSPATAGAAASPVPPPAGPSGTHAPHSAPVPVRGSAYMGMGVIEHDGQGRTPTLRGRAIAHTEGVDVSSHQPTVSWSTLTGSGVKWAYVKATEGNYYKSSTFDDQYTGSYKAGLVRGSYHFATPDVSSGSNQAGYFVDHGGSWSKDGRTLPGVLDIEWNPYGDSCYGLSQAKMVDWIRSFLKTYKSRTGRDAVIYTATSWWKACTGNYAGFAKTNPLWIARYDTSPGELPAGWDYQTIWQYTSTGPTVGDHDRFNGSLDRVKALANG